MTDTSKAFIIYGRLSIKQTQQNIEGFTVEALDKDLLSDDRLGCAKTNKDGY
jgi:hypothetical protein